MTAKTSVSQDPTKLVDRLKSTADGSDSGTPSIAVTSKTLSVTPSAPRPEMSARPTMPKSTVMKTTDM